MNGKKYQYQCVCLPGPLLCLLQQQIHFSMALAAFITNFQFKCFLFWIHACQPRTLFSFCFLLSRSNFCGIICTLSNVVSVFFTRSACDAFKVTHCSLQFQIIWPTQFLIFAYRMKISEPLRKQLFAKLQHAFATVTFTLAKRYRSKCSTFWKSTMIAQASSWMIFFFFN